MDPLSSIEEILGHVDTWPTFIIHNMFVETPHQKSVKTVAAFMYGNGIPCELAIDCFNACNGLNKSVVTKAINSWYAEWDAIPQRRHRTKYYSMFYKQWQWMNGKPVDELEAVSVTWFGIENSGCPLIIRTTINHVRSCTDN